MEVSRKRLSSHYGSKLGILLFLLPGVGAYTLFMLYPSLLSLYYSLLDWQGGPVSAAPFVGFENFKNILQDPFIYNALGNNLRLLILNWVFQLPIALMLAYVLSRLRHGVSFYRFLFYIPVILPTDNIGVALAFYFLWK